MTLEKQYLPLAIKYRPKKFANLMGQKILVDTLSSAIINNRIAHAYLLTGIRGVGKTTSARIIASIVNCENPILDEGEVLACGKCNNCEAVKNGNHPDIVEIDAASRTSVDDVRSIIESSEYKALLGKYKIFIIDEVHMISKNAFNALLKTLEEPPKNVLFIFATTEVNKIPITILSRCQRFDLRRLSSDEVEKLLCNIAEKENIIFEPDALKLIAIKSEGSARDAISMMDQASLLTTTQKNQKIDLELVREMLAITSLDLVISFIENILTQDTKAVLDIISQINRSGANIIYFVENVLDLIGYITKLSAVKDYSENLYATYQKPLAEIASKYNLEILTMIWQIFSKSVTDIKTSHNQILSLEITSIKAIYAANLPSPREVIEALEKRPPRQ
ncbi:MAG UNVERIFIED_CONTAM: DNA polymerase III subunit gamma/tau [Rickettsiaceae bacterium]|jgi:DNA polymerase-3 subunit gamma/tau